MPVEFTCVYSTPNRAKNFKRKAFEFAFLRPQIFRLQATPKKKTASVLTHRNVAFRLESVAVLLRTFLRRRGVPALWQMFRTFVLRCDWSILRILKSTKKHERQSERVTLVSMYITIFFDSTTIIHGLLSLSGEKIFKVTPVSI